MANEMDRPASRNSTYWGVGLIAVLAALLMAWFLRFPWNLLPPQP